MDQSLSEMVQAYRAAMSVVTEMLMKGIITKEEYVIIDTMVASRHGLSSSTLYR